MYLVFVAIIAAGLILPLPALLLDILIICSTIYSLWLLYLVCHSRLVCELVFLPTGLLLSTVLRLSLNVATSRSILSGNQPGGIIELLGKSMLADGIVMGLIIFLLITIILIIVITKGAERVAEVSARFTLDALPGRQMAIDADVRNGLITFEDAQERRSLLQTESRIYGALDGCMKFIKGDAIAGIIILMINIFGGIIIAAGINGMPIVQAFDVYSSLTIGDGLVSQLPAFLNAITAGLILTKIESKKSDGEKLAQEKKNKTRYVLLFALGLTLLSFIPSVPSMAFLCTAACLLLTGFFINKSSKLETTENLVQPQSNFETSIMIISLAEDFQDLSQILTKFEAVLEKINKNCGVPKFELKLKKSEKNYSVKICVRGIEIYSWSALTVVEFENFVEDQAYEALIAQLPNFMDEYKLRMLIDIEAKRGSTTALQLLEQPDISDFLAIIKNLLEEKIPIIDFDLICNAIQSSARETNLLRRLEKVRKAIALRISANFAVNLKVTAYLLDSKYDYELSQAEEQGKLISDELAICLINQLSNLPPGSILVSSSRSRRLVFDYVQMQQLDINVLALEEIIKPFKILILEQLPQLESETPTLQQYYN